MPGIVLAACGVLRRADIKICNRRGRKSAGRPLQGSVPYSSRQRHRHRLRHLGQIARRQFRLCFIGNYTGKGDDIHAKISTLRHNDDPDFKPLFGTDMITLTLKGSGKRRYGRFRRQRAATARRGLQGGADAYRRLAPDPLQSGSRLMREFGYALGEPVVAGQPLVLFLGEAAVGDALGGWRLGVGFRRETPRRSNPAGL